MKRILRTLLLAVLSLQILGGSHALLQTYAWTTMMIAYSQEEGVTQAVINTFNGKKPCAICRRIVSERQSKGFPAVSKVAYEWQNVLPPKPFSLELSFPVPAPPSNLTSPAQLRSQFAPSPLSPPPRILG